MTESARGAQQQRKDKTKLDVAQERTVQTDHPHSLGADVVQRAMHAPQALTPADVIALQRTVGNAAVQRILAGRATPGESHSSRPLVIQPKLTVGPVDDKYEREADRVARQVVDNTHSAPASSTSPGRSVQRNQEEEAVQMKPLAGAFTQRIQRADLDEEDDLQMKATPGTVGLAGGPIGGGLERAIRGAKGVGRPLPDKLRTRMEGGFGASFDNVRVHTGQQADGLNRSLNAKAFTSGSDIFFRRGEFNPGSSGGQKLIAHELTHTVQQGAAGVQRDIVQRTITNIPWSTASAAKPSTSGVKGGVFFVTVNGISHVVKATADVGATKFAEQLTSMLGGNNIVASSSTPIPRPDNEFTAIMQAIKQYEPAQPQRNAFNTDQEFQEAARKHQAYVTKYNDFRQSPYLLIQQNLFTPGTQVLGVEDLSEAISKAGNNKGALQGRVDTDVQAQVNLLTNQSLMKAVGRLLAIDTLTGNADRFEEMNIQNAFMRANNSIGAIDTEAIMQSMTGTKQFSETEIGSGAVPRGSTDVARYVDFVIGHLDTGGGVKISDEGAGTPSSNVAKIVTQFDGWFEKTFAKKFLAWQDPMVKTKFAQLGFPDDGKTGNWPAVKLLVHQGLDEGITAIQSAMSGQQYGQIKGNFQNLSSQYGTDDNFAWDAFRVRGDYIAAIKGGASHAEARQAIIDRLTTRENAKQDVGISPKVLRVLDFGTHNGLLTAKEALQIKKVLQGIPPVTVTKILHISNRGGLTKSKQKLVGGEQGVDALNNRLEAARVQQLKNLVSDQRKFDLKTAIALNTAMADRLRKKDVDQVKYLTKDGRARARNALAMIGVDVNTWGPF